MSTSKSKQLMQEIFAEMAKGNLDPFVVTMADDMQWTWMGSGQWSHTIKGKASVVNELMAAMKETLKPPYQVIPHRFIADGDFVVVELTGENTTPDGLITTNTAGSANLPMASCWNCANIWIQNWSQKLLMKTTNLKFKIL